MRDARMATDVDLQEEVRAMTKHSRQEFLRDIGLPLEIPTDHCLAMKAGLSISWNKFRTLRRSAETISISCTTIHIHVHRIHLHWTYMYHRWLKVFNVSLASEKRQRVLAQQVAGENLSAEMVPLLFVEDNVETFRETQFVFVPNLIAKLADRLTAHQR